MSLLSILVD